MFEVRFDDKAIDALNKLEPHIKKRIFEKILSTKTNPERYFERLEGRRDYKLRVGTYRVIADLNKKNKTISITWIMHRSKVYKRT